ncbi:TauD/TfdA family dioxygenase, partial [Streptomyces sp. NPDC060077]|uniref:TauD/TfdA family dioxygenase n=1 Tax=Streptomyces sp. NPDC060077 TaxID=3347052 RepID=UPI0036495CA6
LLDDLQARATAPERVLRHAWSVGDLVIWDNRGLVRSVHTDRTPLCVAGRPARDGVIVAG